MERSRIRHIGMSLIALVLAIVLQPGAAWATTSNATLTFTESGITETVAGSGYAIDGTTLTIASAGTYVVTGSCAEGSIEVAKGLDEVTLILEDLSLASSSTAPIVVKKGTTAHIHLEGTSTLTDDEDPAAETSSDATVADSFEGACIKVKSGSSVTFCGEGSLICVANAKNGIKAGSTAELIFNQAGTITVTGSGTCYGGTVLGAAVNNGIAADGSIVFNQGSFVIAAANDGIKSAPDATDEAEGTTVDTDSAGTVTIHGGTFDIDVDGDGIQADTALEIHGGTFDIVTYQGSDTWNDTLSAELSCKGLKASGDRASEVGIEPMLTITGGTFTLDCGDDAVHSDADITVTGGTFSIETGDDGMHADTTLTLGTQDGSVARDPDVTIASSYEGLEGGNVYLYSGRYHVTASDDGINAAGGSSSGTDPGHGGGGFNPGSAGTYNIYVYGGSVYVNCSGDGLDSNGGLYLYGGMQEVFSQSRGDNSAIDADGTILIQGATVFTAGTNPMMDPVRASWFGSGQTYRTLSRSLSAGGVVNATLSGDVLYSSSLPKAASFFMYSAPGLSAAPTLTTASRMTACKGGSWSHSWDDGVASDGYVTYTCSVCGATETQSMAPTVTVPACDHEATTVVDEGYGVSFEVGEGASVNVYYTQDYASADEVGVTRAVSRNGDTGEPDSTGNGQVNFTVVLEDGYALEDVAIEGTYKNLKDVSEDAGVAYTYRVTKVASDLTIIVTTSGAVSGPVDIAEAVVAADDQVYDGSALTPEVSVTLKGKELVADVDYEVSYEDNTYPGTATVTVTGLGDYTGKATGSFLIDEPFSDVDASTPHYEDILWLYSSGVTTGWGAYPHRTFRGMNSVIRQDMAAFLYRLAGSPDFVPSEEDIAYFTDVDESTPHAKEIWWLASAGISTGWTMPDGTREFRPRNTVVRQDMAAFLYRLAGKPDFEPADAHRAYFSDVNDATPHAHEIWWLAYVGVSAGWTMKDGTHQFRGMDTVKRQDMAAFLHRLDANGLVG